MGCGTNRTLGDRVLVTIGVRTTDSPGHQTDELEYVVEVGESYVIVDKRDEYERFAE